MTDLAGLLLGGAALLVHTALMVVAAPLLGCRVASGTLPATDPMRWRERVARPYRGLLVQPYRALVVQPYRALGALLARETIRSGNASPLAVAAPPIALSLTLVAACLVPSFAVGLLDAPLADLLLVLGLLGGAQAILLLAAADDGLAASGLEAVGQMANLVLAVPGAIVAVLTLSLLAGGTGLDQILVAQRGGAGLAASCALGLAALAATGRRSVLTQGWSGADLALLRLQDGLQILVWIDLVGGLALPGTLTAARSGPLGWLAGLLFWALRLGLGSLLLGVAGARLESLSSRRRLAGLSLLVAALAPVLLLAGRALA